MKDYKKLKIMAQCHSVKIREEFAKRHKENEKKYRLEFNAQQVTYQFLQKTFREIIEK